MDDEESEIDGSVAAWAEHIGIAVTQTPKGPAFAVALSMPGGGTSMYSFDAYGLLNFCAEVITTVTSEMVHWEDEQPED